MRLALYIMGCLFLSAFLASSVACGKLLEGPHLTTDARMGLISGCFLFFLLAVACWGAARLYEVSERTSRWDAYRRATLSERLHLDEPTRRRGLYSVQSLR